MNSLAPLGARREFCLGPGTKALFKNRDTKITFLAQGRKVCCTQTEVIRWHTGLGRGVGNGDNFSSKNASHQILHYNMFVF